MTEWTVNNKLNDWYRKQYHIKLPKQYETKARLYFTASYSPFELFSTGSVGLWLDPSDLTTMYQDAAGTTPVTTPGQPVGLRLDKSKGLALGAELVANGTFDTDISGWTNSSPGTGAISWLAGAILVERTSGGVTAYQAVPCVSGRFYRVDFSFTSVVSGAPRITASNNVGVPGGGTTNILSGSFYFEATNATMYIHLGLNTGNGTSGTYDNISVRELAGNHATQSVLASRPVYGIEPAGGRRNLLTQTEAFDVNWTQSSVTIANSIITDPVGGLNADSLTVTTNSNDARIRRTTTQAPSTSHTFSVYAKAGTANFLNLYNIATNGIGLAWFNLATGTLGTVASGITAAITSVGDGWYRCSIAQTHASTISTNAVDIRAARTDNSTSVLAGDSIYIWGAQLELGSTATNYQRVTTAFDVTEAGVQSCHYVQYDGSDDGMITNSIDFTATDKMSVFAGVRKLSDAASGIIAELSLNSGSLGGSFGLTSGDYVTAAAAYSFNLNGTQRANITATPFASPISNVVTGILDIAQAARADEIGIRVNGVIPTTAGGGNTNAGTGNFGNHRLNIGRRGNDQVTPTLPFNGRDYGIVVVGKATTAAEITSTESWLAGKTGFYAPIITGVPTIGVS